MWSVPAGNEPSAGGSKAAPSAAATVGSSGSAAESASRRGVDVRVHVADERQPGHAQDPWERRAIARIIAASIGAARVVEAREVNMSHGSRTFPEEFATQAAW